MQCKTGAHVSQSVVRTPETFARRYLLFALIVAVYCAISGLFCGPRVPRRHKMAGPRLGVSPIAC